MTQYSVIPSLPLDPKNESDLLVAASQRVYEASNGRINDFSNSSPVLALLEGQVYAQAEFLYWLNNLPEALVQEWLGPMLGIQRKLGTPSKATLRVEIVPHSTPWVLKAGFIVRTNSSITGEEAQAFTTDSDLVINPQESEGFVNVTSIETGSLQNVGTGIITEFEESLAFLRTVTNITPATGGTDEENNIEMKQRAYSYIRRRNPVSKDDWIAYIKDLIGLDSIVLVKNRRPYIEPGDIDNPYNANHVSYFLLGPGGQLLSNAELSEVSDKIKGHSPINVQVHVHNIDLQDIDFTLVVSYDPSVRGRDLKAFAIQIRDAIANIISPNVFFEIGDNIQVQDIKTLFAQAFAYLSPNLETLTAYSIPQDFKRNDPQFLTWKTGLTYRTDDLIISSGRYYSILEDFDPLGADPNDAVNDGLLQFNRVKEWLDFPHRVNDIVRRWDTVLERWDYHLVLTTVTGDDNIIGNNITAGRVSARKEPINWIPGNSVVANDLVWVIGLDGGNLENEMYLVKVPQTIIDSSSVSDAELAGYLIEVFPDRLEQGESYILGDYVYVANRFSGFDYYKVLNAFTFSNISTPLQEVYNGNLLSVSTADVSPSNFRGRRYKARLSVREFVELFGNIYQVGLDFTPDNSSLVEMLNRRLLYPTEFTLNTNLGGVVDYSIVNLPDGGYLGRWVNNSTITVTPVDTLSDSSVGQGLLLGYTFTEGKAFVPPNLSTPQEPDYYTVVAPGANYLVGDKISVPALISSNVELDRTGRYEVSGTTGGGLVTDIEFNEEMLSTPYAIRRITETVPLVSYAQDSLGEGATLTFDLIYPSVTSNEVFLNNFRVSNVGNGYVEGEVLYADLTSIDYLELIGDDIQIRVVQVEPQFDFKYRPFYEFYKGDIIRVDDNTYVATTNFTPTLNDVNMYINEGIIEYVENNTNQQLLDAKPLFNDPIEYNIPNPLSSLSNVVFFDNKTSVFSPTTNAFDGNSGTFWESREVGTGIPNTSFIGVDLGYDAYIVSIDFLHTPIFNILQPTTSSFEIQYSIVGVNGPWYTVATGTNSELTQNFILNKRARYWRFIATGVTPVGSQARWRITNIAFNGDIATKSIRKEDFILYDANNSVTVYRVMRTFTPVENSEPRSEELDKKLLKVVQAYTCDDYVKTRSDYSGFDMGGIRIDFHPHGLPNQITRFVMDNKLGTNIVFSYEPGGDTERIVNYGLGTIAL